MNPAPLTFAEDEFLFVCFLFVCFLVGVFSSPGTNVLGEVLAYPRRRRCRRHRRRRRRRQFQVKVFVY